MISSMSTFILRIIILANNVLALSMNLVLYVPFVRLKASLNASAVCKGNISGYKKWNNAHNSCKELSVRIFSMEWGTFVRAFQ